MSNLTTKQQEKYDLFVNKLKRCLINPKSEKEFIQLLLKNFYIVDDKIVRLKVINDCFTYLKKLQKMEVDAVDVYDLTNQEASDYFNKIEREICQSYTNDKTVNYMISGFFEALEDIYSLKVRHHVYNFVHELIMLLHKMTAMNYSCGTGGGLVLYTASLFESNVTNPPIAIFYFGAK